MVDTSRPKCANGVLIMTDEWCRNWLTGWPITNCCFVVIGRQGIPQCFAAASKNRSPRPPLVRPSYGPTQASAILVGSFFSGRWLAFRHYRCFMLQGSVVVVLRYHFICLGVPKLQGMPEFWWISYSKTVQIKTDHSASASLLHEEIIGRIWLRLIDYRTDGYVHWEQRSPFIS